DEFVVLLPDTEPSAARQVADRLVTFVRAVGVRYDPDVPVTASVGLALARADDEARALVQRADQHAYKSKQAGGDRVSAEPAGPEWTGQDDSRVRPAKAARR
ncbi:MAG: diguanylate cyclase, partial [Myxococcales bacterium]|nr:diguanylate cyclase [Myxococcales bacterium]